MTSDPTSDVIWGHFRSLEKYFEVIRGRKRNIKRSEQFVYDCLVTSMPQWINDLKFDLRGHLRSFEVTWGHIRSKLTIYEYSYTDDHSDTIRNLRSLRSLRSLRLKSPKKVKITVKNAIKTYLYKANQKLTIHNNKAIITKMKSNKIEDFSHFEFDFPCPLFCRA